MIQVDSTGGIERLDGKVGAPESKRSGLVDVLDAVLEQSQLAVEAALGSGRSGRFVDFRA